MDGGVVDRLRRVDHRIWDGLLALAVAALGLVTLVGIGRNRGTFPNDPDPLAVVLVLASALPLAWRRRAPLVVAVLVGASVTTFSLLQYQPALLAPHAVAMYSAAAYRPRGRLVAVLLPIAVATTLAVDVADRANDPVDGGVNWTELLAGAAATSGIPIALGRMTFNRRRRIARERDLAAREAVAAERARIARELHDVVAHHMSVMVVQAGAARSVGRSDPSAAAEALRQIEASGRVGLGEMRRLLEILARDEEGDRVPQPGLDVLDELLDGMRAAGLPVETVVEGSPRPLPPGVDLSAYRIVQEALTNALKHAGPASARVVVRYEPEALEVEVADDGVGIPPDGAVVGGHGLIGMRERVQLFGGTFAAGPRPGGGFAVRARLPLGDRG